MDLKIASSPLRTGMFAFRVAHRLTSNGT
jgi:hypothetical protein